MAAIGITSCPGVVISQVTGHSIRESLIHLEDVPNAHVSQVHGHGVDGHVVYGKNIGGTIDAVSGCNVGGSVVRIEGGAVERNRADELRSLLNLPADVENSAIEEAIRQLDGIAGREQQEARLSKTGLGRWAKEHGLDIAQLLAAVVAIFSG